MLGCLVTYAFAFVVWQLVRGGDADVATWVGDLAFPPVTLVAAGFAAAAARADWLDPRARRAWACIAGATLCYFVGDLTWAVYEVGLGESPFPSPADAFYLVFYPLLLAGLLLFPVASRSARERRQLTLDLGTVFVAGSMAIWYLVLGPTATSTEGGALSAVLSAAYPVGDLVLLFGIATVLARGSTAASRGSLQLLMLGLACFVFADVGFGYLSLNDGYRSGDWPDTMWMAANVLIAASGWRQCRPSPARALADERRRVFRISMLPYGAIVLVWGMVMFAARHEPVFPMVGLLVGGLLLMVLVFVRQLTAVREHAALMEEYHHLASTDTLTGLRNRRRFLEEAERELARAERASRPVSVLMIDVDRFKDVNDTFGHAVGDEALCKIADDLREALREGDLIGRCGGDEFAALLPDCDAEQAATVAARIQAARSRAWRNNGSEPIDLRVSVGVVTARHGDLDRLLALADAALYDAKESGRACTRIALAG